MAIGVTEFLKRFPEFRRTDHDLIEAKLAEAAIEIDSGIWGDKYDLGLGYLAAHLLSLAPSGQHARLVPPNAKAERGDALTTYERQYKRLVLKVSHGFRVTGDPPGTET